MPKDIKLQKAEDGKGLSTNDYTTAEKNKLAGIATGATNVKVNNTLTSTSTTDALSAAQGKVLADGKAQKSHTHTTTDVTGLQDALDSKLDEYTGTLTAYTGHYLQFDISDRYKDSYSKGNLKSGGSPGLNQLDYTERKAQVATCIVLTPDEIRLSQDAGKDSGYHWFSLSGSKDINDIRAIHVQALNQDVVAGYSSFNEDVGGRGGNVKKIKIWYRYVGKESLPSQRLMFSITLIL